MTMKFYRCLVLIALLCGCEGINTTATGYANVQQQEKNASKQQPSNQPSKEVMVATKNSEKASDREIEIIAEQAYLYGLQQVIFYGQRWMYTQNDNANNPSYVGINRFYQVRQKITPDFPVVTPNATTLYGSGFIDLQNGPVILEMPEITDRYFSAQVMDQYGIFHTMVGKPFNGTKANKYIFLPQGYKGSIPRGFSTQNVIFWPSKIGYIVVRVAVETGKLAEIEKINVWQDKMTLTPLKKWMANNNAGVKRTDKDVVPGAYYVPKNLPNIAKGQVDKQSAEDFFILLDAVLQDASMNVMADSLKEQVMINKLANLGIGTGNQFEWNNLDEVTRQSLTNGFKAGFANVRESVKNRLINLNGWMEIRNSGHYQTQWLDRAIMADVGWAGPDRNVSHTGAFLFTDDQGQILTGDHQYTLTFDMNNLPPVDEFWSIPIYNKDGYFVENEINRYTINSFMIKHKQLHIADNKLIIYVQHHKPTEANKLRNWLPAPPGVFRFTARFYHPKVAIVDGSYPMPKPRLIQ